MTATEMLRTALLFTFLLMGISIRVCAQEASSPPSSVPAGGESAVAKETPAPTPTEPRPEPNRTLLFVGLEILGGAYVFSVLVGLMLVSEVMVDEGETCVNCQSAGAPMFIPLVGPFIALPHADEGAGRVVSALMGSVQVAGLCVAAIGLGWYLAVKKKADRWDERHRTARWRPGIAADRQTALFTLGTRF